MNKAQMGCGGLIVLVLLNYAFCQSSKDSTTSPSTSAVSPPTPAAPVVTAEDRANAAKLTKALADAGLLEKWEPERARAWVNPVLWAGMTVDQKNMVLKSMLGVELIEGGRSWLKIMDNRSGKVLAENNGGMISLK